MSTPQLLELFAGLIGATMALWLLRLSREGGSSNARADQTPGLQSGWMGLWLKRYLLSRGTLGNAGLLVLRLAIGVMMIHHGQDKLANPQAFADTYVTPLHLPFPLVMAYAAGFAEVIGSWMLILGLLAPLGALAIAGTMTVAAYQHILTAGLNIYVLELVVLYLGGSLALLLLGPGRFSFDGAMAAELIDERSADNPSTSSNEQASLQPELIAGSVSG